MSKVRTYKKTLSLNEAVEKAVEECIREGILREFLLANKAEVVAMSIFEYDKEEEEKKLRKAEFEAGVEHGIEQSLVSLVIKKMKKGNQYWILLASFWEFCFWFGLSGYILPFRRIGRLMKQNSIIFKRGIITVSWH